MDTSYETTVDAQLLKRFKLGARLAAVLIIVFGLVVSIGWIFDLPVLTHPISGTIPSSTSLGLIISGAAVLLVSSVRRKLNYAGIGLSLVVLLSGLLTFIEDVSGQDLGMEHLWLQTNPESPGFTFPGPMAPDVSWMFLLIGTGLLLFGRKIRGFYVFQFPILGALIISLIPLIGQACGSPYLCTMAGCIKMPASASIAFLTLSCACLFVAPEFGLTEIYVTRSTGGRLTRSFSAVLMALPILLWIKTAGEKAGYYDAPLGWVVFGIISLIMIFAMVARNAKSLDRLEADRSDALQRLEEATSAANQAGFYRKPKLKNVCLHCLKEYPDEYQACPYDGEQLTKLADDPIIGSVVSERYQILSVLGSGGMSSVYKAQHVSLPKMFAVKVVHAYLAKDVNIVKRFQHEAKAASSLSHPNLIEVQDFGFTPDGQAYLVMECLDGVSLGEVIVKGALSLTEALPIFAQICDGLEYAHNRGLVHRDLKPSNIMVLSGTNNKIKIVDFGLAKNLTIEASKKLTQTGEVFGTPHYMAPEQCYGEKADARTDIYAMGCIMYECLTGERPFDAESPIEIMRRHISEVAPPVPSTAGLPEWIGKEIARALEKERSHRHQSMSELKAALESGAATSLGKPG